MTHDEGWTVITVAELAELRREREKFREALEKIASDRYNFRDFCDIARAALEDMK